MIELHEQNDGFPESFESDIFLGILATIQFLLIEKYSVNQGNS